MEAICPPEMSVDTQLITRRYIPEDGTLHNHRCENLKSYNILHNHHHENISTKSDWNKDKSGNM
jgi:hypothetical protein